MWEPIPHQEEGLDYQESFIRYSSNIFRLILVLLGISFDCC
jgi:hypothetical protein